MSFVFQKNKRTSLPPNPKPKCSLRRNLHAERNTSLPCDHGQSYNGKINTMAHKHCFMPINIPGLLLRRKSQMLSIQTFCALRNSSTNLLTNSRFRDSQILHTEYYVTPEYDTVCQVLHCILVSINIKIVLHA